MKKFGESYNPILEDQNFYKYEKLVNACFEYIRDAEKDLKYPKEVLSLISYLAKNVYEFGFCDGLTIDNVCEEEQEIIYN